MSVIDRVGQTWEFYDGLIIYVIASEPDASGTVIHDVLVLYNAAGPARFAPGTFSPRWHEKSAWESRPEERWRIA